jgi:acyl dehydratase
MPERTPPPTAGEIHAVERTFTTEDVRQFAQVSGDTQPRHTEPDEDGRLLVHGLLTATLPTTVGGDLEMLARTMSFEFVRPVYTGETVTCTWTHDHVEERDDRYEVTADVVCENEDGATVLTGTVAGLVRKGD